MSVIVNTDYESILFENKPSLKLVRELEFLGLWLNDSVKNVVDYDQKYLEYIQSYTGTQPSLVRSDKKAINWWGELKDLSKERYLNSKETSLHLARELGESFGTIVNSFSELESLEPDKKYLFKSFSGVSGRGHKFIDQIKESDFPLIAEEFHNRDIDFSTYVLSSGEFIFYQNFIGPQFGYKGSFFDLENAESLLDLDFVKNRDLDWRDYLEKIKSITKVVRSYGSHGFSVDSYVFNQKIRSLCEINYRRTMGITAYEIARKVSSKRFQLFLIIKTDKTFHGIKDVVVLSPERNMFSYLLISNDSKEELRGKLEEISLAAGTGLTINIE